MNSMSSLLAVLYQARTQPPSQLCAKRVGLLARIRLRAMRVGLFRYWALRAEMC